MCLKDRQVGYKGLKDTSHTFSCYFASECTHVISLIVGFITEKKKSACMHMWFSKIISFLWTEIQGAPLCKQMNTLESKTNNRWAKQTPQVMILGRWTYRHNSRLFSSRLLRAFTSSSHSKCVRWIKVSGLGQSERQSVMQIMFFSVVVVVCVIVCMKYTRKPSWQKLCLLC